MVWNKVVVYSIFKKYMDSIVLWMNFVIFKDLNILPVGSYRERLATQMIHRTAGVHPLGESVRNEWVL